MAGEIGSVFRCKINRRYFSIFSFTIQHCGKPGMVLFAPASAGNRDLVRRDELP